MPELTGGEVVNYVSKSFLFKFLLKDNIEIHLTREDTLFVDNQSDEELASRLHIRLDGDDLVLKLKD